MSLTIQASYPSYNTVNNYSGSHATIKSAGRVNNVEQNDAIIALEREGRLNLSQFGFIRLPREVLYAQDVKDSKVKATRQGDNVQSSSKTDTDEDRTLSKVKEATDNYVAIDAISGKKDKKEETANDDSKDRSNEFFSPDAAPTADDKASDSANALEFNDFSKESPSVTGSPNNTYQTVQFAAEKSANGQQLSVTA